MYSSKGKASKSGGGSSHKAKLSADLKSRTIQYLQRGQKKYELKTQQLEEDPRSGVIRSLGLGDIDGLLSYDDSASELSEDSFEKLAADYDLLLNDVELLEAKEKLWNSERETLQRHISLLKLETEMLQQKVAQLEGRSDLSTDAAQPGPSKSSKTSPTTIAVQSPVLTPAVESCSTVAAGKTKQSEAEKEPVAQQASKSKPQQQVSQNAGKSSKKAQKGQQSQTESCEEDRKEKTKGRKKRTPDLIFVRPAPGQSYLDILRTLRKCEELCKNPVVVEKHRRLENDVLLMRLKRSADSKAIESVIRKAVGDNGTVTMTTPMSTITCTNLDGLTVAKELHKAILKHHGVNVKLDDIQLKNAGHGVQRARIRLAARDGKKLDGQQLVIGTSTVTFRLEMPKPPEEERCFRCAGLGHQARECQEKQALCFRCGKDGHRASDCKNAPKCQVCKGEHKTGSRKCVQSAEAVGLAVAF